MIISNMLPLLALTFVAAVGAYWRPSPDEFHVPLQGDHNGNAFQISLYPPDGPVDVWSGSTLQAFQKEPKTHSVAVVALYLHWCPHCQRLVPEWSALAGAFNGTKGISIAALNCADQVNEQACDSVNVSGFPTIVCFGCPQDSKDLCKGDPCEITSGYEFDGSTRFDERVVQWISNVSKGALKPAHELKTVQHQHEEVLVVGPPGIPGWIPSFFFPPGNHNADALRCLLSVLWQKNDVDSALFVLRFLTKVFGNTASLCHYKDLTLWDSRGTSKGLEGLQASIEGGQGNKTVSLRNLLSVFAEQHGIRGLGEEPVFPKYENEKLSTPDASHGYQTCLTTTCAMWTFLHVVTSASAALGEQGPVQVSTGEVLQFVRRFVLDFLQCRECQQHFLARFDQCEYGRCVVGNSTDWKGLVLWLWRAHNGVSMRVAAERDNKEDRRWPSFEDCPTCWKATEALELNQKSAVAKEVDQYMDKFDGMFNLTETYSWIVLNYAGEKQDALLCSESSGKWQIDSKILPSPTAITSGTSWFIAGVVVLVLLACIMLRKTTRAHSTLLLNTYHDIE